MRGLVLAGLAILLNILAACASQGQRAATDFDASIAVPAFLPNAGPVIHVDHGHHNFHRIDGRFGPFAALARNDGFRVEPFEGAFTPEALATVSILIIANAVGAGNKSETDWTLPNAPAFTDAEIDALESWVGEGGALLLVADHMPFDGAASGLAARFGFEFTNGFVLIPARKGAPDVFAGDRLRNHPILQGRASADRVDQVKTFIGSAFRPPETADPFLVFSDGFVSLEPERAWVFDDETPRYSVDGWALAATRGYGLGRIAVYSEAGMLTAQVRSDGSAMGFNAPGAEQNKQFIRNTLHWLAGLLPLR